MQAFYIMGRRNSNEVEMEAVENRWVYRVIFQHRLMPKQKERVDAVRLSKDVTDDKCSIKSSNRLQLCS